MRPGGNSMILNISMVQLFLVVLQFVLGMWINLFVPSPPPPVEPYYMGYVMTIVFQNPEIMVHMMNGFLVGLLAIMLIVASIMSGRGQLIGMSIANGLFVLLAGISGMLFLMSGMQNNFLSLSMAMGFIGVVITEIGIMNISWAGMRSRIRPYS